tara:strand:+ start:3997 stop:4212 length:216 start_codon:yes stop_codon:yes gene_type:complete
MDKEKLLKGLSWISVMILSIFISATFIFKGFELSDQGNHLILCIGIFFLIVIFFTAYKGFKLISNSIFDEK